MQMVLDIWSRQTPTMFTQFTPPLTVSKILISLMILFFLTSETCPTWLEDFDHHLFVPFGVVGLENFGVLSSAEVPGKFQVVARSAVNLAYPKVGV